MVEEKEASETDQKKKAGAAIVFGCALTTLAIVSEGPLQWVLYAIAIATLGYGVFLGNRAKKSKPV